MKKTIADKIQGRLERRNSPVPPKPSIAVRAPFTPLQAPKIDAAELQRQYLVASMDRDEVDRCIADAREGRIYTLKDISTMLQCSRGMARILFMQEPSVVRLGTEYRVPDTVFQRVVKRSMRRRGLLSLVFFQLYILMDMLFQSRAKLMVSKEYFSDIRCASEDLGIKSETVQRARNGCKNETKTRRKWSPRQPTTDP